MIKIDEAGTQIKGSSPEIMNEFFNIALNITVIHGFEDLVKMTVDGSEIVGMDKEYEDFVKDIMWAFLKNKAVWKKEGEIDGDE